MDALRVAGHAELFSRYSALCVSSASGDEAARSTEIALESIVGPWARLAGLWYLHGSACPSRKHRESRRMLTMSALGTPFARRSAQRRSRRALRLNDLTDCRFRFARRVSSATINIDATTPSPLRSA